MKRKNIISDGMVSSLENLNRRSNVDLPNDHEKIEPEESM